MEEKAANALEMAAQANEEREKAEKTAQSGIKVIIYNYFSKFYSLIDNKTMNLSYHNQT